MANTPVKNLIKTHSAHGWTPQSTDHIRNVSLVQSHALLACPCGWRGWVKKSVLRIDSSASSNSNNEGETS